MGYFLTDKSRIQQTDIDGYWKLIDNELYMDNNGAISLTPRYFWTDGYTFPKLILPFLGDKNKFDVRPCHAHDLFCRFHQRIYVNLSLFQLKQLGFLHAHNNIVVCEDIPVKYLIVDKISKRKSNNLLKEMMLSCKINKRICNIVRFGVNFNFGWRKTGKKDILSYNIYKEDIGLVNGL